MNKKTHYILTTAAIAFFLVLAGCSLNSNKDSEEEIQEETQTPKETETESNTDQNQAKPTPEIVTPTEPIPRSINCGTDTDCLKKNIISCTPATGDVSMFTATFNITIKNDGYNCIIRHTAKSGMQDEFAGWIGKFYDCTFSKDELANNPSIYEDQAWGNPMEYCSGPYIDVLKEFSNNNNSTKL